MNKCKLLNIIRILSFLSISVFVVSSNIKAATSLPTVKGPIPVTKTSYPFLAAERTNQDLAKFGYVEEEYFISGFANVYDLDSENKIIVKASDAPYTTRMLIRRPESAEKFSGTVIVELLNPTGRYDLDQQWLYSRHYFMRSNDIWIGLTSKPITVNALKMFDPERYKSLSWANPLPPDKTCPNPFSHLKDTTPENENGLIWDIASQLGALLKSKKTNNPLNEFSVKSVLMTGYSQTGGYIVTYVNFIRPLNFARLANGEPVYDGYLVGDGDAGAPALNQCAPPFSPIDPRIIIQPCPEPVISIVTQTSAGYSSAVRRPDSDTATDRYRRFEIAGSSHIGQQEILDLWPNNEDTAKAGGIVRSKEHICEELKIYGYSDFPFDLFMDGAFANLKAWVQSGTAPAKSEPMKVKNVSNSRFPVPETDKFGNAIGGVRSPYVDVPVATYYATSTPLIQALALVCWLSGYKKPFKKELLRKLYPSRKIYINKVKKSVADLVKKRLITKVDGEKMIKEAGNVSFK